MQYERVSLRENVRTLSARGSVSSARRYSQNKGQDMRMVTIVNQLSELDSGQEFAAMTLDERVKVLLDSTPFQAFMAGCIMLNAAVIGGETDYPELEIWKLIENAFLAIFSAELLLRLLSVGVRKFFARGEDQLWNLFDFMIVSLGVFDIMCETLGMRTPDPETHTGHKQQDAGVSTLFRMIRLLRILRVFKIVRFLKQLYMIFFGFVEAIQAICLVSVLMFFVLYLCSVVMVRTYGRLPLGPDDKAIEVVYKFKTVKTSMLSLFELMSDPGNLQVYHNAMEDYPILTMFLVAFVVFGSFGMVALLTGVISESMFDKNQTRVQELRHEREQKREILKEKCIELFGLVEKDHNGRASPHDLQEMLPCIRDVFEKLDIEYMEHEFEDIISMCDIDETGSIDESEFVSGILSLCDGVRAASVLEVYYIVSHMSAKISKLEKYNDELRQATKIAIPELQTEVKKMSKALEIQSLSQPLGNSGSSPKVFDTSGATRWTEAHFGDMKASMASQMDEQKVIMSKKFDDLKGILAELCRKQDIVNGNVFTLAEAQITNRSWANFECPVAKNESGSGGTQSNGKGVPAPSLLSSQPNSGAMMSQPIAVGASGNLPGLGTSGNLPSQTLSADPNPSKREVLDIMDLIK